MLTAGPPSAPAAVAMNKGVAAPTHKAATLPKARILLAPNTLTSCFEPPQGNAAERTLTYEEPRRSPPPRIWAFSRPSFVPHTEPGPAAGAARGRRMRAPLFCLAPSPWLRGSPPPDGPRRG